MANDRLSEHKREIAKRALAGEEVDIHKEFAKAEYQHDAQKRLEDKLKPAPKRNNPGFTPAKTDALRSGGVNPKPYLEKPELNPESTIYRPPKKIETLEPPLMPNLVRDQSTTVQSTLNRLQNQQMTVPVPVVTAKKLPSEAELKSRQKQHKLIIGVVILILITLVLIGLQAIVNIDDKDIDAEHSAQSLIDKVGPNEFLVKALDTYQNPTLIELADSDNEKILEQLGIEFEQIVLSSIKGEIELLRYQDGFMISFQSNDYALMNRALRQWEPNTSELIYMAGKYSPTFQDETYLGVDYRVFRPDIASKLAYTIDRSGQVIIGSSPEFIMQAQMDQ